MKSPLEQPNTKPTFTQVAGTGADQITIVGGGAAWIDTDLSGTSVPATATSIFIIAVPAVNQPVGAGITDVVAFAVAGVGGFGTTLVTGQTTARHCHLRREAGGNTVYSIVGYIE